MQLYIFNSLLEIDCIILFFKALTRSTANNEYLGTTAVGNDHASRGSSHHGQVSDQLKLIYLTLATRGRHLVMPTRDQAHITEDQGHLVKTAICCNNSNGDLRCPGWILYSIWDILR